MYFDVGDGHNIYFEEYGNPKGIKILFLHGGPGLGFSDSDKALFDADKFYVLFIDQRGCGQSVPKGSLNYNTTQDLLSDIDKILDHLDIDSITIFGGSWGATLAVLYAAKRAGKVKRLILRGFFPATKDCTNIYLRGRIRKTHPQAWERVSSLVPTYMKGREAEFYFEQIGLKNDASIRLGKEWSRYGFSLSRKHYSEDELNDIMESENVDTDRIRIELYYALNDFFIPEGHVFNEATRIQNIPTVIIHGEYDYLCPLSEAHKLNDIIPESRLVILDAGHSVAEPVTRAALLKELDKL